MACFLYKINHYEQTCGTSRNLLAVFNNLNQPTSKNTDVQKIKLLQINSMLLEITIKEKTSAASTTNSYKLIDIHLQDCRNQPSSLHIIY
jgi:hypothetical protein